MEWYLVTIKYHTGVRDFKSIKDMALYLPTSLFEP